MHGINMGEIYRRLEPTKALPAAASILVTDSGIHDLTLNGTPARLQAAAEAKLAQTAPRVDHRPGKGLTGPQAKATFGYGSVATLHTTGGTYRVTEDTVYGPDH
jgi:hypothetical protein